jgi:cytochrome c551/c552
VELGEQLYNTKCIACHQFEQKMVGPAYKDVLPKYEGDLEKLKAFILNPVKVNPEFIPMPNQGLKPHEAESAAMFLMQKYEASK